MTSDADLEAIWRAFRRDPAELYKLVALVTASARLHAEAMLAAARRAPAAEEHRARVGEPAEGRGGAVRICPLADAQCVAWCKTGREEDCPLTKRRFGMDDPTGTDPAPRAETPLEMARRIGRTTPDIYPPQTKPPRINPEGAW